MNIFNIIETTYINTSFVEKLKLSFNQFFVVGRTGKIIVIETGFKSGFLQFCDNMVAKGFDPKNIIGVITPHFEADEMGAIGEFMKISPNLKVYSHPICSHGIHDIFGAKTVPVKDGEDVVIDGIKFKFVYTKHVHQWDSLVVFVPENKILFSSDIFIQKSKCVGTRLDSDIFPEIADEIFNAEYLPSLSYFRLAVEKIYTLNPLIIAPMHGSPFKLTSNMLFDKILNDSRIIG